MNHTTRQETLDNLANTAYDIVIIGGGITGAGLLLDAVSRGYKAILVEKTDFAVGTSSRSTKLIHGGLRYLKKLEFKIVRDTGRERAIAYKNAPHLVVPAKLVLPIREKGSYGKIGTSIGLWVYDRLAGVEKAERRKMLNKSETLQQEPLLKSEGLKGSGYYSEYRTDDARLTIEIIKTAVEKGAHVINYAECKDLIKDSNKIVKIQIHDRIAKSDYNITGSHFINATGPWSDLIRKNDQSLNHKKLHLTKGVHIVVDHSKLPIKNSIYFDVADGRMIFAIPRGKITYIGTTDTNYSASIDQPNVTANDVDYLITASNIMFPKSQITTSDVQSSWSGLRPLIHEEGKSPSELSRKDEIFLSDSGLITIAGGKLTGYRLMAKKVIDIIGKRNGKKIKCSTHHIKIAGGNSIDSKNILQHIEKISKDGDLSIAIADSLFRNYGIQSFEIINLVKSINRTLIEAQAVYCLKNEMTLTLIDFYIRHSGMMYFDILEINNSLESVADLFSKELNWTETVKSYEIQKVNEEIKERTSFK
ncbi:MAG: glycerol-3-phosphate dehydrogenase [Flavobacteriales bacterium]|jgi:glycerol-3-phosphate dehydrogenase